jgi:hypothetical protein
MRAILIALSLCLMLSPAFAGQGNNGKNKSERGSDGGSDVSLAVDISVIFSTDETRIIRDYFHANPYTPQALPPGIAKNLARGKPLPPGIAKRYLPAGLGTRLPHHDGYEDIIVGSDIVRIAVATGIIIDILKDVF